MIITIIGNKTNPNQEQIADGGRIKVSLYYRVLKEEGFDVRFIELEGWMKRFALLVIKIKKAVMRSDVVLIMGGPRGSRVLITLCNLFNRKGKTRIIYSMLGVGTIQQKIKSLSPKEIAEFLNGTNNYGIKDSSMGRKLRKLSLVLAENDVQAKFYNNFYGLSNVSIMENFRIINNRHIFENANSKPSKIKRFVFFGRVNKEKGIFDALDAIKIINEDNNACLLDVFGDLELNDKEIEKFNLALDKNIKYLGIIENKKFVETLSQYDFMIFPSVFHGEGTPGVIMEALISGLPVLSSDFPQAGELISDGYNGLIFKSNNIESLVEKIKEILAFSDEKFNTFKVNAYESGNKYTYEYVRERFLSYITGIKEESF